MDNLFTDDYYERGLEKGLSCYSNYRWIPELTIPMCHDIISYLDIEENQTVLDFGCAKGYTVKGMRLLHRKAFGVDISSYAISSAPNEVKEFIQLIDVKDKIPLFNENKYDWVIAKDVLEHIEYNEIVNILKNIKEVTNNLFVIVPLGKDNKYEIPAYELDITHKIREPIGWWNYTFNISGFNVISSEYLVPHLKENWATWKNGNGFFKLESI